MVPEGSRLPRRGRIVRVVGGMFSSPSDVEVEVWLEESLGREVEGAAIAGTGVSGSGETWWVWRLIWWRFLDGNGESWDDGSCLWVMGRVSRSVSRDVIMQRRIGTSELGLVRTRRVLM